jgi:hypothetical protein
MERGQMSDVRDMRDKKFPCPGAARAALMQNHSSYTWVSQTISVGLEAPALNQPYRHALNALGNLAD